MRVLEDLGFIRIKPSGNQPYGFVLLVHPAKVVEELLAKKLVPQDWLDSYNVRQIETKEKTLEERKQSAVEAAGKVVSINSKGKKIATSKAG